MRLEALRCRGGCVWVRRFPRLEVAPLLGLTTSAPPWLLLRLQSAAIRLTVEDATSLDPVSRITGGRRYSFNIDGCGPRPHEHIRRNPFTHTHLLL